MTKSSNHPPRRSDREGDPGAARPDHEPAPSTGWPGVVGMGFLLDELGLTEDPHR